MQQQCGQSCDGGIGIIINIESPEWGTDADADTCAALAVP